MFGMQHLLLDLYQVCAYDAPGVKTVPAPSGGGVRHNFEHRNKEENFEVLFSENGRPRALIFGM